MLETSNIKSRIERGETEIPVKADIREITAILDVSNCQRQSLLAGGTLNLVRKELAGDAL